MTVPENRQELLRLAEHWLLLPRPKAERVRGIAPAGPRVLAANGPATSARRPLINHDPSVGSLRRGERRARWYGRRSPSAVSSEICVQLALDPRPRNAVLLASPNLSQASGASA